MAPTGLLESFAAANQASLSVLLVVFYGGLAGYLGLLTPANSKAISKLCVRMFLPALLFTHIGSQLHADSARRYLIVFIWALVCHLVSFIIGVVAHLWLGMPDWTTVALMFNNTTSYPLLLIAALDQTGILGSLLIANETTAAAVERAKSYFLVFATVSSCLTFAVGPRLIDTEHAPEPTKTPEDAIEYVGSDDEVTERTRLLRATSVHADPYMQNSFLPSKRRMSIAVSAPPPVNRKLSNVPHSRWDQFSPRAKWWILFITDFFNAPLVGAILGVVVGLAPLLRKAFFADTIDGGIFTAWLTASLKNIGGLFVPLPVLVAGVSLYMSMRQSCEEGNQAGGFPWLTSIFVLIIRFVTWPAVSIYVIYLLASKTDILGPDPMLWFALMLMPTGPPAMKLITLVQARGPSQWCRR